jgi:iron(III) transport system substrate-binding protein
MRSIRKLPQRATVLVAALVVFGLAGCSSPPEQPVTVYSGRSEELIGPLLQRFSEETGVKVAVRYASTASLVALLLEEGDRTKADLFIAQDAGALGAVQHAGMFANLDTALLERVPESYRSPESQWVGISGRARSVVYNTDAVSTEDLPTSIFGFADPEWSGRLGWAPMNGSFQAWLTALRVADGDDVARGWLEDLEANGVTAYPNNSSIVEAVGRGEIDAGFVNHYYLYRFLAEKGDDFPARNHFTGPGDPGTFVNVAGAGIIADSDASDGAAQLLEFLLSNESQAYLTGENFEYPLVAEVEPAVELVPLRELVPAEIDLSDLDDLEATLKLLQSSDVLP